MANTVLPWTAYTEAVVGLNHPTLADADNRAFRAALARSSFGPDSVFRGLPVGSSAINAGSSDYTGTAPVRITAAIADAVAAGLPYCFVPRIAWDGLALLPYNANLVTFNNAVQMIREGFVLAGAYEVQAYGAAGNNVQDDTAAFQAAANAAQAAASSIWVSDCTVLYRLNGTVTLSGNNRRWYQDFGGVIGDWNATGPCLKFAGVSAQMSNLVIDGLQIKRQAGAHRIPMVQIGDANGIINLRVNAIQLDGNSQLGDGIWLWSVFNGSIQDVVLLNHGGGIPCLYRNDPSLNVGNINFINWVENSFAGPMFLVQEYYGLANNLINSLHFDNCKHALASGGKFFAGALNGNQSINSTTLVLQAGQGANYASGDWILVFHSGLMWCDKVASVNVDTLTLTASAGTPFALSTNDPVINGGWHTALGPNVQDAIFTIPHFERVNGIIGTNVTGVDVRQPRFGVNVLRGAYLVAACQNWTIDKPTGGATTAFTILHQGNDANNSRNAVKNISAMSAASPLPTVYQRDGGSIVTTPERFGGAQMDIGPFHQDTTVAANQAGVVLTGPMGAARDVLIGGGGAAVRLRVYTSSARTLGTLTATLFQNGSSTGLTAVIDGTNPQKVVTDAYFSSQVVALLPKDNIDIRITTDANWAPTANNIDVYLTIEQ